MELGQRIMIIGCGGAGKSTLARQLGELLDLPVIHLDTHFWQPGWVEMPKAEWLRTVETLTQGDRWIIDGNYTGTLHIRFAAADTVLFLDYSRWLCLWRVIGRIVRYYGQTRPDLGPGCQERFDWSIFPFIRWVCIDFPRRSRVRIMKLLEQCTDELKIVTHRSPRETRRLLEALSVVAEKDHV